MSLCCRVFGVASFLAMVCSVPMMSQEGSLLRLKTRSIVAGPQAAPRSPEGKGRVHLIARTDGSPLDLERLAERGVIVLGHIPDNGVAISAWADEDLSGLGFRWIGSLEAGDRQGFPKSAASADAIAYYVVQFYSDVDMGDARTRVLGAQIGVQENPSLLPTQLLVAGTQAQMVGLSEWESVVYIFPASDELIGGAPVTACVSGNSAYGMLLPMASSLSGGWSINDQGIANLTYSFGPLTDKIPADTVRQLFLQAQQQWASLALISFTESASRGGARNVDLGFYAGAHGDQFPFDGQGGVLAHTYYPAPPNPEPIAGDMHMDADESWSNSGSGTDFYSVALHELGHALGLGHTTGPQDVMYPFYRHNTTFSPTDIAAIQSLYLARSGPVAQPLALSVQTLAGQVTDSTIAMAGTTSGGQGTVRVTWTTDRGGLGTAQGAASWTVAAVPLALGRNVITVKGQDDVVAVTQTMVVVRLDNTPPPPPPAVVPTAPLIFVASPVDGSQTALTVADVKGTAVHPVGIRSISWRLGTGATGMAQGTTAWDTGPIGLLAGVNRVTIDAVALDGGTASKTIQITVASETVPPSAAPPGSGGSDTTPPSLAIVLPGTTSVLTSSASITISGTSSDNVGVAAVRWETPLAGGVASGTTYWSTGPIPLNIGMNNIVIRAFDTAGNSSWRTVSVTRQ